MAMHSLLAPVPPRRDTPPMSQATHPIRLGITIGDPGGIGPEVGLRAVAAAWPPEVQFTLLGPRAVWQGHADWLERPFPGVRAVLDTVPIEDTPDPAPGGRIELGSTCARHGVIVRQAVEHGVSACLAEELDALVTAPISKEGLKAAGSPFPGHTEMLQHLTDSSDVLMLLAGGGLRVALVTIHVALRHAIELVTPKRIVEKATILDAFLTDWLDRRPSIGVCGLNPHAGEGGLFGDEEISAIKPAIEEACRHGILLDGPHPADTIFHDALAGRFDAVLAMYHDQGLIPIKTLAFHSGVNITAGLPIIRTSPDHGTAFGIAGKGVANKGSMTAAIETAADLVRARRRARG